MKDKILLRGVSLLCRVGVPAEERRSPQPVELDLELEVDLRRAGASDALEDSVDYWAVERRLRSELESREFRLLEALAESAARAALACDRRVRSVLVRASKRPSVMPRTGSVAVELLRRRARSR